MVFREIMIIKGVILTTEDVFKLAMKLGSHEDEFINKCGEIYNLWKSNNDDLIYEIIEQINYVYIDNYPGNMKLYRFPC